MDLSSIDRPTDPNQQSSGQPTGTNINDPQYAIKLLAGAWQQEQDIDKLRKECENLVSLYKALQKEYKTLQKENQTLRAELTTLRQTTERKLRM